MVDRILFWVDAGILHFGIAKNLQEKLNADLYVIYDFNNHLNEGALKSFNNICLRTRAYGNKLT